MRVFCMTTELYCMLKKELQYMLHVCEVYIKVLIKGFGVLQHI